MNLSTAANALEFVSSYMNQLAHPGSILTTQSMLNKNKAKWNIEFVTVDTIPGISSPTLIRVKFLTTEYGLSIQHAAMACGTSYAETALLDISLRGMIYDSDLGYGDVCRHEDVGELEQDIQTLLDKIHAMSADAKTEDTEPA
jgi:hypothetical protein